jgi:hypothetical protein
MVTKSHTISQIGYTKSLPLRSNFGLKFSTTQQSGPRSITHRRRVTCAAAAAENVSFFISDFFFYYYYDMGGDKNNVLSISITILFYN